MNDHAEDERAQVPSRTSQAHRAAEDEASALRVQISMARGESLIPPQAIEAYDEALRAYGSASLRVHGTTKPGAARPREWTVVATGRVVAASQPHLIGRPERP